MAWYSQDRVHHVWQWLCQAVAKCVPVQTMWRENLHNALFAMVRNRSHCLPDLFRCITSGTHPKLLSVYVTLSLDSTSKMLWQRPIYHIVCIFTFVVIFFVRHCVTNFLTIFSSYLFHTDWRGTPLTPLSSYQSASRSRLITVMTPAFVYLRAADSV